MEFKINTERSYSGILCKCCGRNGHILKDLWGVNLVEGGRGIYGEMIAKCFAVYWQKPVDRTELICESCVETLLFAFKFKTDLLASEQILLEQLEDKDSECNKIADKHMTDNSLLQEDLNRDSENRAVIGDIKEEVEYFEDSINVEPVKKEKVEDNENAEDDTRDDNIIQEHLIPFEESENKVIPDNSAHFEETTVIVDIKEEVEYLEDSVKAEPVKREKVLKNASPTGLCDQNIPSSSSLTQRKCARAPSTSSCDIEEQEQAADKFTCDICNGDFKRKNALAKHMRNIHKFVSKTRILFKCEVCNKQYPNNSFLIRHQRAHTGEKPYLCEICNKQFSQRSHLFTHQRIHTGNKPYSCNVCNKRVLRSSDFVRHQRTHTDSRTAGDKPHSCKICNKQFSSVAHLSRHQRIHTGEKSHSCIVCNKQFRDSWNLIRHQGMHTGKKPYSCETCNKQFTDKRYLSRHERTHSSGEA